MQQAKQNKQRNMQEHILKESFKLMSKHGVKDISMREIACACGVTKPVLYYYFKDKDDLCYQLIKTSIQDYHNALFTLVNKEAQLEDIIEYIFKSYANNFGAVEGASSFALHLYSYLRMDSDIARKLDALKQGGKKQLAVIFDKELTNGCLTPQAKEILEHLIIAVISHLILNIHDKTLHFSKTYPRDMAQAVLKAVAYKKKKGEILK